MGPIEQQLRSVSVPKPLSERRVPEKEFLILFLARTGSSHLADLLTSAGVGDVREWLNPTFLKAQAEHFGAKSFKDYFAAIRSRCPRGVFAQKMTIWFYELFAHEVRLEDFFRFDVPAVFLFRENIVEQAVSLQFATSRNAFHHRDPLTQPALPEVAYDAAAIRKWIEAFADEEERLQRFAAEHGSNLRYLSYERLAETEPVAIVQAIASLVSVVPQLDRMKSLHQKMGDELNRSQATRFIEEELDYVESIAARRQWLFDAAESQPLI